MTFNHKPVNPIECPDRFKPIIEEIISKLDNKNLFESDLRHFLDKYDQDTKEGLLQWLKNNN
jgi:hypothetical protein